MPTAGEYPNPPDVREPERLSLEELRARVLQQNQCDHQWDYIGYRLIEDHWIAGLITEPTVKHHWVKCRKCGHRWLMSPEEWIANLQRTDSPELPPALRNLSAELLKSAVNSAAGEPAACPTSGPILESVGNPPLATSQTAPATSTTAEKDSRPKPEVCEHP